MLMLKPPWRELTRCEEVAYDFFIVEMSEIIFMTNGCYKSSSTVTRFVASKMKQYLRKSLHSSEMPTGKEGCRFVFAMTCMMILGTT